MLHDRLLFGRRCDLFTLQWHVTNACELRCRHCYDRSKRDTLDLDEARRVVRDLASFCRSKGVRGEVCLTGGNPFLYPRFEDLYRSVSDAGFPISILGNPVSAGEIDAIDRIRRPFFYQVSLEGLREHDDEIRGRGHFDRTIAFLDLLRERGIRSVVMLTLTRANLDQTIPLAEALRDRTDGFAFTRLSQVGEGASLDLPSPEEFAGFLERYLAAGRTNPILRYKEGLFNVLRRRAGRPLFGGCTGHGCGAAFNFVALLPDGEVHACRKFPSPVGNVRSATFEEIYDSQAAQEYRAGCRACRFCPLRRSCGGCMAVTFGRGLDPLRERDPHCFTAVSPRTSGTRC